MNRCRGTEATEALIKDLLVAIARHPSERQWHPIKTAPKDGTWIYVVSVHNHYMRGAVQWLNGSFVDWTDEPNDVLQLCTHWMPLPDPPVKETP